MVRQQLNSGFSLIETLIVLMILGVSSVLIVKPMTTARSKADDFASLVVHTQFAALFYHHDQNVETDIATDYPIRFNPNGNVNMGQTIEIGNKRIIILIATGRIHEKSFLDD